MIAISLGCNGAYVTTAAENVLRQRWGAIADHVHMPVWAGYVHGAACVSVSVCVCVCGFVLVLFGCM